MTDLSDLSDEAVKALLDGTTAGPWVMETVRTSCGTCHRIGPFPRPAYASKPEGWACVYDDYPPGVGSPDLLANSRLMTAAPILARALLAARAELAQARADADAAVADIVRSVWGRCEALEDEAADKLAQLEKLTDHEMGFWRGQKTVAKSIRRSTEMPTAEAIAIRRAEGGKA